MKILYCSTLSCFDVSNGASISVMETIECLHGFGFDCSVFTINKKLFQLDDQNNNSYFKRIEKFSAQLKIKVRIEDTASDRFGDYRAGESQKILSSFREFISQVKPDIVFISRHDPLDDLFLVIAKSMMIRTLILIKTLDIKNNSIIKNADICVVPSKFVKSYYESYFKREYHVIPNPISSFRIQCGFHQPDYVTFVNPEPRKGALIVLAIIDRICLLRPDIRFLIVEARGKLNEENEYVQRFNRFENVRILKFQNDPKEFWMLTKIALMPSIYEETFGRVAAEAIVNGIPVVCSTRGALKEVVSDAGILIELSDRIVGYPNRLPQNGDIDEWVESIVRLWDQRDLYQKIKENAIDRSQLFSYDKVANDFFKLLVTSSSISD